MVGWLVIMCSWSYHHVILIRRFCRSYWTLTSFNIVVHFEHLVVEHSVLGHCKLLFLYTFYNYSQTCLVTPSFKQWIVIFNLNINFTSQYILATNCLIRPYFSIPSEVHLRQGWLYMNQLLPNIIFFRRVWRYQRGN